MDNFGALTLQTTAPQTRCLWKRPLPLPPAPLLPRTCFSRKPSSLNPTIQPQIPPSSSSIKINQSITHSLKKHLPGTHHRHREQGLRSTELSLKDIKPHGGWLPNTSRTCAVPLAHHHRYPLYPTPSNTRSFVRLPSFLLDWRLVELISP